MIQIDINFCILLFYIFLRYLMAFDKELVILFGFFNLRLSKKFNPSTKKAPMRSIKQSRSILFDPLKYTVENQKIWSFFSVFDHVITHSRNLGASFLVFQKLLMIFQIWAKFHFIWLSISDFNWDRRGGEAGGGSLPPPIHRTSTSIKSHIQNRLNYIYVPFLKVAIWFVFALCGLIVFMVYWAIVYSEPYQTAKMELFAKIATSKAVKPLLRCLKGF